MSKVKKHEIVSAAVKPEMKVAIDALAKSRGVTRSVLIASFLEYAMDQHQAAHGDRFEQVIQT